MRKTQNGLKNLIIINITVFIFQLLLDSLIPTQGISRFTTLFALVPREFMQGYVWQGITYMFLHGGFFHLLINMYILWMFGRELEYLWGTKEFYKYYFICGIGAAIIYSLFNMTSDTPVVGASGAIFGILLAYGITFPRTKLIMFPLLIPIDAKYAVWIFGIIEVYNSLRGGGNIAHLAHLGGLAVGYIYLRWKRRKLY
jgi:membrane associated rhomboid family serine protease